MNPLVNGMPAKASRNVANDVATHGERFPRPAQRLRSVTYTALSRTSVTTANATTVATPYANK